MSARPGYAGEAMALLLIGAAAQFGWHHVPADMQADVWNACQALLALLLLTMVGNAYRGKVLLVAVLLGVWQALTAACSVAYLVRPWRIEPGAGQCSSLLNWPIGAAEAWLAMVLAWAIYREAGHGART